MTEGAVDLQAELAAMTAVTTALVGLSPEQAGRVLRWAMEAHGLKGAGPKGHRQDKQDDTTGDVPRFEAFADMYAATSPQTDVDRALVAGYWRQFVEGEADWGAQEINALLKDLGHALANVTTALDALKEKKPALALQLKKAGTTRQARKTYKLTVAGKQAVEMMINQQQ